MTMMIKIIIYHSQIMYIQHTSTKDAEEIPELVKLSTVEGQHVKVCFKLTLMPH